MLTILHLCTITSYPCFVCVCVLWFLSLLRFFCLSFLVLFLISKTCINVIAYDSEPNISRISQLFFHKLLQLGYFSKPKALILKFYQAYNPCNWSVIKISINGLHQYCILRAVPLYSVYIYMLLNACLYISQVC